jgi:hypothetical protein
MSCQWCWNTWFKKTIWTMNTHDHIWLQEIIQLISDITVFNVIRNSGICWYHTVLGTDINCIINFPINISYFSGRMKKTLKQRKYIHVTLTYTDLKYKHHVLKHFTWIWHRKYRLVRKIPATLKRFLATILEWELLHMDNIILIPRKPALSP